MSLLETNLYLLQCWQVAYGVACEAVLAPFGLGEADIDAVLTVDAATRRRWAALPVALAQPRPGLLTALRANNNARIHGFIGGGRDRLTTPAVARLCKPINAHLLAAWSGIAGDAEACRTFGLDAADRTALDGASETVLANWSPLPITLATPEPGLLPGLFAAVEPRFAAFIHALQA